MAWSCNVKTETQYFQCVNLEKYQHYTKRAPPWIKFHASTLEDYDFARLQDASKMHLCAIWLLASRTDNRIPWDIEWIARRINATAEVDLDALQDAGFIELIGDASTTLTTREQGASKALAPRKQSALSETETETEGQKKTCYQPTSRDARELRDIMHLATGSTETEKTALEWLRTTKSAESFSTVKEILKGMLSKKRGPDSHENEWFRSVLKTL